MRALAELWFAELGPVGPSRAKRWLNCNSLQRPSTRRPDSCKPRWPPARAKTSAGIINDGQSDQRQPAPPPASSDDTLSISHPRSVSECLDRVKGPLAGSGSTSYIDLSNSAVTPAVPIRHRVRLAFCTSMCPKTQGRVLPSHWARV